MMVGWDSKGITFSRKSSCHARVISYKRANAHTLFLLLHRKEVSRDKASTHSLPFYRDCATVTLVKTKTKSRSKIDSRLEIMCQIKFIIIVVSFVKIFSQRLSREKIENNNKSASILIGLIFLHKLNYHELRVVLLPVPRFFNLPNSSRLAVLKF